MREIVHIQIGQCGNQIGAKVRKSRVKVPDAKPTYAGVPGRKLGLSGLQILAKRMVY